MLHAGKLGYGVMGPGQQRANDAAQMVLLLSYSARCQRAMPSAQPEECSRGRRDPEPDSVTFAVAGHGDGTQAAKWNSDGLRADNAYMWPTRFSRRCPHASASPTGR